MIILGQIGQPSLSEIVRFVREVGPDVGKRIDPRRMENSKENKKRWQSSSWKHFGGVAQLGERVVCNHEVVGSIPIVSIRKSFSGNRLWRAIPLRNSYSDATAEPRLAHNLTQVFSQQVIPSEPKYGQPLGN